MLRHKHIERICCLILAATLVLTCGFMGAAAGGWIGVNTNIGYENRLFDKSRVHTIDIVMNDWESFIRSATSEEYASCTVIIDGESYKNVAIRGKGNTSLSSVASYDNDRYSFKIEFDHYQTGHTYHGLDKLSLNNLIYDNTYMKDYFAYTLMEKMGVAAPLCSFVQINVNGENFGLYLAVEGVEDSFLQRNYGKAYGELYKPDSLSFGGGRGNGGGFDMGDFMGNFGDFSMPDMGNVQIPDMGNFDFSQMMGGGRSSAKATATPEPEVQATEAPKGFDPTQMMGGFDFSQMPGGFDPSQMPSGGAMPQMPGMSRPAAAATPAPEAKNSFDPTQMMGGFDPSQMPSGGAMPQMPGMSRPAAAATPAPEAETSKRPSGFDPSQMMGGGGFGFGMGSSDVKLQYIDDNVSSYSNIFSGAKTDVTAADQARLIAALKKLSEGDLSSIDTESVAMYLAVHNFLVNDDSYTGTMVHNYYLYEENGVMQMIPWDYNLAFGTFSGGSNATSSVNTPIDGDNSDRPMAGWVTANEENLALYHEKYQQFIDEVFNSGWFSEEIDRVYLMLTPYVANDASAFCTTEEFDLAVQTLKTFCEKRAQSVQGQLEGTIPSTGAAQRNSDALIDAGDIATANMGSMGGGMGMGGKGGDKGFSFGGDRSSKDRMQSQPETERPEERSESKSSSRGSFTMPTGGFGGMNSAASAQNHLPMLLASAGVLIIALLFALLYKNKR